MKRVRIIIIISCGGCCISLWTSALPGLPVQRFTQSQPTFVTLKTDHNMQYASSAPFCKLKAKTLHVFKCHLRGLPIGENELGDHTDRNGLALGLLVRKGTLEWRI